MEKTGHYPDPELYARLRHTARLLLEAGASPKTGSGTLGLDALELLYRRASDPESTADALKLLHELQTHQVELDLLYEQLQANEYEINGELAHYQDLFESAPVAYLVIASDGRIIESNTAAVALFGRSAEQLTEMPVSDLLAPENRADLSILFQQPLAPGARATCSANLSVNHETGQARRITIHSTVDARGESVFMTLSDTPNPATPEP